MQVPAVSKKPCNQNAVWGYLFHVSVVTSMSSTRSLNTQWHPSQMLPKPRFMLCMSWVTGTALFTPCSNKPALTLAVHCRTNGADVDVSDVPYFVTHRTVSLCALHGHRQTKLLWAASRCSSERWVTAAAPSWHGGDIDTTPGQHWRDAVTFDPPPPSILPPHTAAP